MHIDLSLSFFISRSRVPQVFDVNTYKAFPAPSICFSSIALQVYLHLWRSRKPERAILHRQITLTC